jgi:RimJ/RimL family protein N-acetyltransferase
MELMKKSLEIETKRLILRDFVPGDWKAAYEYGSDPIVVRFMPWGPNSISQTKAFIRRVSQASRKRPRTKFEFAVILKSENRLIGGCGIRIQNIKFREADMGYCFNPRFWGKGYATEAAKAVIHFGFSKLKLHRIWATCDPHNKASTRVLEKAGMKREGLLRQNVFQKGAWRDSYLYAILEKKPHQRH